MLRVDPPYPAVSCLSLLIFALLAGLSRLFLAGGLPATMSGATMLR